MTCGKQVGSSREVYMGAGAGARGSLSRGESRLLGESAGPAGLEATNREKTRIVARLAGLGHELGDLLEVPGLKRGSYLYYNRSHPESVTRADLEDMMAEIFARAPNGCVHRQIRMALVHEYSPPRQCSKS